MNLLKSTETLQKVNEIFQKSNSKSRRIPLNRDA